MDTFALIGPDGQAYPISGETLFGRDPSCTYTLQDPQISRRHATVFLSGGALMVRDEGSANGTFVNGARIAEPTSLAEGDTLRLGETIFTVQPQAASEAAPAHEPAAADSGSPPASTTGPGGGRSRVPWLVAGCAALALCLVVGAVGFALLPATGALSGLLDNIPGLPGQYTLEEALADEVVDDRAEVLAYLGQPDAFTISQVVVEGVPLRLETWRYYGFGTRVDFVDGEVAWTIDIEPVPEYTIFPAWYDPLAFELGMSPSEVARVATQASPAGMSPESIDLSEGGEDLVGSTMLVGDQIMIGLAPSGVVYVETMALFPSEEGG